MSCVCPPPSRPIAAETLPRIVRSLASVGGVYDFVAAAIAHQGGHTSIESLEGTR